MDPSFFQESCKEKGETCDICKIGWVGKEFSRVPAPYPDYTNRGHYLSVFNTPTTSKDGKPREVDDFAPRANIKKLFKSGKLASNNVQQIQEAAKSLCVEEQHITAYVKHLEELATLAEIRERDRKRKKQIDTNKSYNDYNWTELIETNELKKLKVMELEKYLVYHKLPLIGKKSDKLKRIKANYYISHKEPVQSHKEPVQDGDDYDTISEQSDVDSDSSDDESSDDDDEVIGVIDDITEDLTDTDLPELSDTEILNNLTKTTRCGRRLRLPGNLQYQDFLYY